MNYKRKVTVNLAPDSAKLECDGGLELEFTCDKSDVLDYFDVDEIAAHFDADDLLEAIGQDRVEQWVSENNQ